MLSAPSMVASGQRVTGISNIAGIIDEEKKVKHSKFGQKIEEVITDPSKIKIKLKPENVDISYPPIVQSGGVYDLRPSATTDDRPLQYDVVLMAIGEAQFSWNSFTRLTAMTWGQLTSSSSNLMQ